MRDDFGGDNASADMQDSLYDPGAVTVLSQAQVGLCFSSELSTSQPLHLSGSCFWYYHRHSKWQTAPSHWWLPVWLGAVYHMLLIVTGVTTF